MLLFLHTDTKGERVLRTVRAEEHPYSTLESVNAGFIQWTNPIILFLIGFILCLRARNLVIRLIHTLRAFCHFPQTQNRCSKDHLSGLPTIYQNSKRLIKSLCKTNPSNSHIAQSPTLDKLAHVSVNRCFVLSLALIHTLWHCVIAAKRWLI